MAAHSISPVRFAPPSLDARGWLVPAWNHLLAMLDARRSRRLLLEMDGRMLADLGISRGQAGAEAARPFWDLAPARR